MLREYYRAEDDESEHNKKLKYKNEGLFEAGLIVKQQSEKILSLLLMRNIWQFFGMSRKERRAMKKLTLDPITKDWSSFDGPAIDRIK